MIADRLNNHYSLFSVACSHLVSINVLLQDWLCLPSSQDSITCPKNTSWPFVAFCLWEAIDTRETMTHFVDQWHKVDYLMPTASHFNRYNHLYAQETLFNWVYTEYQIVFHLQHVRSSVFGCSKDITKSTSIKHNNKLLLPELERRQPSDSTYGDTLSHWIRYLESPKKGLRGGHGRCQRDKLCQEKFVRRFRKCLKTTVICIGGNRDITKPSDSVHTIWCIPTECASFREQPVPTTTPSRC